MEDMFLFEDTPITHISLFTFYSTTNTTVQINCSLLRNCTLFVKIHMFTY